MRATHRNRLANPPRCGSWIGLPSGLPNSWHPTKVYNNVLSCFPRNGGGCRGAAHTSQQRTHPLGEKKSTMAALPGGLPDNLTAAARVGQDAQTGHPTVFPPPTLHPQILQTLTLGPLSTPISSRPFFSTPHSLNPAQSLAPKGLHLQHAHIKGPLDFPHALLTAPLHRKGCLFPEQATFADARVARPCPIQLPAAKRPARRSPSR